MDSLHLHDTRKSTYEVWTRVARESWDGSPYANFRVEIDGNNISGVYSLGDTGGWDKWVTVNVGQATLNAGTHRAVIRAVNNDGRTGLFNFNLFQFVPLGDQPIPQEEIPTDPTTPDAPQSPVPADPDPGQTDPDPTPTTPPKPAKAFYIEAEDYGLGGKNVSYFDQSPGNDGGAYRNDDVDIEVTSDIGGGYNVGYVDNGEWIKYDFSTASKATFTVAVRLARFQHESTEETYFNLYIDGRRVGDRNTVRSTGDWQAWDNQIIGTITLSAGDHVLEFNTKNNSLGWGLMNVNWFKLVPEGQDLNLPAPTSPPTQPAPDPAEPDPTPPAESDSDNDGIVDSQDACPNNTGPSSNNGCPVVTSPPSQGSFLSYPQRSPVSIDGGSNIELSNFSVVGGTIAITLRNVNGAYIHDIDFANVVGGIYLYNCQNVIIERVRGRNVGDGTIGSGHSNYVQFAESRGGAVRDSIFVGGRTEDMISTWHSGGWGPGNELIIEDNLVIGYLTDQPNARTWTGSSSGTGVILSDGEGSGNNGHIIVRNNIFVNPGQVGIQFIDGPNLKAYGNTVIGEANPKSNQPFSSWEGSPQAEIYGNRYHWRKPDGSLTPGWFHVSVNFHDNTQDTSLSPSNYPAPF